MHADGFKRWRGAAADVDGWGETRGGAYSPPLRVPGQKVPDPDGGRYSLSTPVYLGGLN